MYSNWHSCRMGYCLEEVSNWRVAEAYIPCLVGCSNNFYQPREPLALFIQVRYYLRYWCVQKVSFHLSSIVDLRNWKDIKKKLVSFEWSTFACVVTLNFWVAFSVQAEFILYILCLIYWWFQNVEPDVKVSCSQGKFPDNNLLTEN